MNTRLTVITTGGTIGSALQSDALSVDATGGLIAQEIARVQQRLGCELDVRSPLNKNSESFGPADWRSVLQVLLEANETDVDGIVVTHGTDTMAYSVAAAVACSGIWRKRVCFTGSYYSPDYDPSETALCLQASLEFAASSTAAPGVYMAFRSNASNTEATVIDGFALKPMEFDAEFFEGAYLDVVSRFSLDHGLDDCESPLQAMPSLGLTRLPELHDLEGARSRVAIVSLHPGIDYNFLVNASAGRDVLVVQMYHSGTGPADADYRDLLDFIAERRCTVLMGTLPGRRISVPYDSTLRIGEAGARVYAELQPHFLYVFAVLGLSLGLSPDDVAARLVDWEL